MLVVTRADDGTFDMVVNSALCAVAIPCDDGFGGILRNVGFIGWLYAQDLLDLIEIWFTSNPQEDYILGTGSGAQTGVETRQW